jgi:hypothetical protein
MKVIYVEPGLSVIQAFADAYFACTNEPITICGNGVRAIFMPDDNSDEIEEIEPKQYIEVKIIPPPICTEIKTCANYTRAVGSICNGKNFANCNFYPKSEEMEVAKKVEA